MDNPFLKRATEQYRRDNEAFLSVVSPEPLNNFLGDYAREGQLYDRLIVFQGTPGSGKTTLARVFEYHTLSALLRNPVPFRSMLDVLVGFGAIKDDLPCVIGCRISMENDYRDFWEFPYPNEVKARLMIGLIQARAIQSWLNGLISSGIEMTQIRLGLKDDASATAMTIGGSDVSSVMAQAQKIELALYRIVAAMVPPPLSELDEVISEVYRPFDIVDHITVQYNVGGEIASRSLTPLVILDDAHVLHRDQFEQMRRWLMGRELRIARWVMTRLDILQPQESLAIATKDRTQIPDLPGVTAQRDVIEILMQSSRGKGNRQRNAFRRAARDMADRYLGQMPIFSRHGHDSFAKLLIGEHKGVISKSKIDDLEKSIEAAKSRMKIPRESFNSLADEARNFRTSGNPVTRDVELQILSILLHRFEKRLPHGGLFENEELDITDRNIRLPAADSSVYEAACIHLHHRYGRPLYYGIDDVCDASSENAEQFLRLAAGLVETMAVRITRSKPPALEPTVQHDSLVAEAKKIVEKWDFPKHRQIRSLIDKIAERCLSETLKANAWIGAGANAYGVPQREFDQLVSKNEDLASLLHFALAYNAVSLVPDYPCKNEQWCLIELGGHTLLRHGLTLRRGGFIEGTLVELAVMASGSEE